MAGSEYSEAPQALPLGSIQLSSWVKRRARLFDIRLQRFNVQCGRFLNSNGFRPTGVCISEFEV